MGKETIQLFKDESNNVDSVVFTVTASNLNKKNNKVTIFTYGVKGDETVVLKSVPEVTPEEPSPVAIALNDKNGSPITFPVNTKLIVELSKGDYVVGIVEAGGGTSISLQVIYD